MKIDETIEWNEIKKRFKQIESSTGTDDSTGEINQLGELAWKRECSMKQKKLRNPIEPVINTAICINWNWETHAKPRIDRFLNEFPEINSLEKLDNLIKSTEPVYFLKYYLNINSKNPTSNPKYKLLKNLCQGFITYKTDHHLSDDIDAMKHWADRICLLNLKNDQIGSLKGVGLGAVQNLTLVLGYDVLKPDRHVINIAKSTLGISLKPEEFSVLSEKLGVSQTYLDKVLYEYGRNKKLNR